MSSSSTGNKEFLIGYIVVPIAIAMIGWIISLIINKKKAIKGLPLSIHEQVKRLHPVFTTGFSNVNRKIIGRKSTIKRIKDKIILDRLVVLQGMGGIGKTKIAKSLFLDKSLKYKYKGWVNYSGNMKASIVKAFENSGIVFRKGMSVDDSWSLIESVLNTVKKSCLLIIDNVDSLKADDKTIALAMGLDCHVLMTSRCKLSNDHGLNIGFLEPSDCKKLFTKYYKKAYTDEQLNQIVKIAGSHTMTIELMAKTAQVTDEDLTAFLSILNEAGFNLEGIKEKVDTEWDGTEALLKNHMLKVFKISSLSKQERIILKRLSLFVAFPVSIAHIKNILELSDVKHINRLITKGWLQEDEKTATIEMHGIIRAMAKDKYKPKYDKCKGIVQYMAERLDWNLDQCFVDVLPYFETAVDVYKSFKNTCKIEMARLAFNIAKVYNEQCDYEKALAWYHKDLAISEKVLGKEHPDTATTYNNIALVYSCQGDYGGALKWYRKDLAISEKVLGKEHPNTATTYNNIAGVYSRQGDYDLALEWYRKALAIREKVLGKEHPSTATTYNNIACVYSRQGDYDLALEWYRKALAIHEKVLGKEHPDTASTYHNIAGVYESQGDYDGALEWYGKALTIFERKLGKDHPHTKIVHENIENLQDQIKNEADDIA